MYRELNEASRRAVDAEEFAAAYREAAEVATLRGLEFDDPDDPGTARGRDRGAGRGGGGDRRLRSRRSRLALPVADGGVAWDPSLVFPGLRTGEHLENRVELAPRAADPRPRTERRSPRARPRLANTRSAAPRSTSPAKSARRDEEDLPALARQGFPPGTPVGVSGLEQAFNTRLAGKPGGSLLAVATRRRRGAHPRRGRAPARRAREDDDRPRPPAGRRLGPRRALPAGSPSSIPAAATSAPSPVRPSPPRSPPGSTFKMITTTAALQKGAVTLDD